MFDEHTFSTKLGDQEITFSTGKIARLAGGAVIAKSGETVLLATATMSDPREGVGFFPLTVNFEERLYAAGRIPGSFFRREGRPSERAILTCRLIDRPLRPLFPKDMRNDVQIIITPLSQGEEEYSDILGVVAASAALMISDIPFDGPVAAVRIGYLDGELVVNPTISQMKESTLDLRVAGSADAIIMVEAGADEVEEALMLDAIELAHASIQDAIQIQNEMREAIGKPKRDDYPRFGTPEALIEKVEAIATDRLRALLRETQLKEDRDAAFAKIEEEVMAEMAEEAEANEWTEDDVRDAFQSAFKKVVRDRILDDNVRPDGRDQRTIRDLDAEVGLMPRPHGTGLFTRGETQVLSLATLGMPGEEQMMDDLFPEETKRYIHHYNFPPYSTGETWILRGPRRRDIGHGALAERALEPVLPPQEEFPYTIRVVSEVMASNGSTSMASVCGSTLSLMDAGVPIKAPVGGIAMGLVSDGERYRVLTDIQGLEDHLGDMDFKVTGTREGITALQMDIKLKGVTRAILTEALEQAKEARLQILDVIEKTIPEPRAELSTYAPKMLTIKIDPEMIGLIIGPGGKNIRATQDKFDVQIDVEEDGTVFVAAESGAGAQEAIEYIRSITTPPEEGEIYTGRVVRITDFGAFVEILPGTDGLVHISQLSDEHVRSVEDVVNVGDEVLVMVTNVGRDNKIRLSRKAVINGWTLEQAQEDDQPKRSSRGGRSPRRR
ncbi:MAG: polyribonucleotide nucleotidyltransferase [Anaerolineales bacterium]